MVGGVRVIERGSLERLLFSVTQARYRTDRWRSKRFASDDMRRKCWRATLPTHLKYEGLRAKSSLLSFAESLDRLDHKFTLTDYVFGRERT